MKILFLTHYALLYGANRSLLALVQFLQQQGEQVCVCVGEDGDFVRLLSEKNIPYMQIDFAVAMHYEPAHEPFWKKILRKAYSKFLILKRHLQNRKAIQRITNEIQKEGENYDFVYSNSTIFDIGHDLAQKLNIAHVQHLREFGYDDYMFRPDRSMTYHRRRLAAADLKICISKAIQNYYFPKADAHTFWVYNGVFTASELHNIEQNPKPKRSENSFLLIGLIHPNKGTHQAIEALAMLKQIAHTRYKNLRLHIAGQCNVKGYMQRLEQLIATYNLENNVVFLDFVSEPRKLYQQATAVLVCSQKEGMGRVTAEAMALHTPVIARNSGASAELIEHGKTGLHYESTQELSAQMLWALENPHIMENMAEKAYRFAKENFIVERYAGRVHELLIQTKKRTIKHTK
ncbi:MAG: glycosyltransferase family 4 protein [Bernardetiaceae bacterium]|nr:glycosyltransferase family 4 protein [Bernardetiaceae bacterium]